MPENFENYCTMPSYNYVVKELSTPKHDTKSSWCLFSESWC